MRGDRAARVGGSDECVNGLVASSAFSAEELKSIDNNAAVFFPRFR
jgi:hypothetical protein